MGRTRDFRLPKSVERLLSLVPLLGPHFLGASCCDVQGESALRKALLVALTQGEAAGGFVSGPTVCLGVHGSIRVRQGGCVLAKRVPPGLAFLLFAWLQENLPTWDGHLPVGSSTVPYEGQT